MITSLFCRFRFSTTFQELMTSSKQSRVKDVSNLKELLSELYSVKPAMHCIIFQASWNPLNDAANQMYNDVSNKFLAYKFYRINISTNDRAEQYFGIRHTPTLLYYGLGSPLGKHIGLGQNNLETKLKKGQEYVHQANLLTDTNVWEGPQDQWRMKYDEDQAQFDYFSR